MLSASELASMRSTLNSSLPDGGTVYRYTGAADGQGGETQTFAAVGTAACRISPARDLASSATEPVAGDKLTSVTEWIVTFPQGTDVLAADQVRSGGRTFEVVGALARSWELGRRVRAVEVL